MQLGNNSEDLEVCRKSIVCTEAYRITYLNCNLSCKDHANQGFFSSEMDVCLSGFVADKVFNADKVYKVCNVDTPVQSPGYLLAGAESTFQPF